MQTIGTRWPRDRECEDYVAVCAYCSTPQPRSRLSRDGAGLLVCPAHGDGLDRVTLDELNAEGAAEELGPVEQDGGEYPKPAFTVTPLTSILASWTTR